jgi:hypothetical protein
MAPRLTIKTSGRGLERVVIHTAADRPADDGIALLARVLPALRELDRCARSRRGR